MRAQKGFTLIELMIVVVIIGILAAIAIPKFSSVSRSAKEAEAAPILKQLFTLQERHQQATGSYATALNQLEGAGVNFTGAKYYGFALGNSTGLIYVACATPLDPALGLRSFNVTQTGTVAQGPC